jgi:hypothetical protein
MTYYPLLADGGDPSPFLLFAALIIFGPVLLSAVLGRLVLRGRAGRGTYIFIWLASLVGMGVALDVDNVSGNVLATMLGYSLGAALVAACFSFCYEGLRRKRKTE